MPAGYKAGIPSIVPPSLSIHPVAAVFPGIANPVDYLTTNASSIIDAGDPDSSVSTNCHAIAAVNDSINAPAVSMPLPANDATTPISVLHLFWRVSASVPNDVPSDFDYLIDNGSYLVLIRETLANSLALRRHKLHVPIETELAMREGDRKVVVRLYDYVKLRLYDSSGEYSAKSVCAIVSPNLVAPLPLAHNSIVIDHNARTAIDVTHGTRATRQTV